MQNKAMQDMFTEFVKSDQLTLGEFINLLEGLGQQSTITLYGGWDDRIHPGELHSYRGFYDELAIGYSNQPSTVESLLAKCRAAIGKVFEGYKGGEFTMNRHTPLWVSHYGSAGSLKVIGVEHNDNGSYIVETKTSEE